MKEMINLVGGKAIFIAIVTILVTVNASNLRKRYQSNNQRIMRIEKMLELQNKQLILHQSKISDLTKTVEIQKNRIDDLVGTILILQRNKTSHKKEYPIFRKKIMLSKTGRVLPIKTVCEKDKTVFSAKNFGRVNRIQQDEHVPIHRGQRLLQPPTSSTHQPHTVAFYALLSQTEISPGPHHTIAFDLVKTNINNGYNHLSGIFTAPIDGVYGFISTIKMPCFVYGTFEIMKNAEVECTIHINTQSTCAGQMATGSIVVTMMKGDIVYVRTHSTIAPTGNIESNKYGIPYFGGWIIAPL